MKKILFALLLVSACCQQGQAQKQTDTVPKALLTNDSTYWTISTLSGVYYVNTTPGAYYGSTTSGGGMLVQFRFLPGNRFRFQLYVQSNMYNTRAETWTEVEGKVIFTKDAKGQDIFITTAEKGTYRMNNNGNIKTRPVTRAELQNTHSSKYVWQKTMLKGDDQYMYLLMVDLKAHPEADVNNPSTINPDWVSKFHIPVAK